MAIPITFQPMGRTVDADPGESLWGAAIRAGVPLASICGGQGTCGKCRVRIVRGQVSPASEAEHELLTSDERAAGFRLACETRALGPLVIETPLVREDRHSKIAVSDFGPMVDVAPGVTQVYVQVPPPSLADPRADAARLRDTLVGLGYPPPRFPLETLRDLPGALRAGDFHLTCVLDGDRLIAIAPGDARAGFLGLAVDLGTTTIAAYLMHLGTGEQIAAAAAANRQAAFGDDVMSRLSYAASGGISDLHAATVDAINDLIRATCRSAGASPHSIYAMTLTGNTTMQHFLAGLPTAHLGVAPYVAAISDQRRVAAGALGLAIHPLASVWFLPGAGAYAGADCVSAALATGLAESDEVQLLVDFGTNAEIVLGSRSGIAACATAAGPAFEGARIRHGMRAAPGAIDRVWIEDGAVRVRTIGDQTPVGLAGTGLVSAIAALRTAGLLDDRGLFREQDRLRPERWTPGPGGMDLVLVKPARQRPAITLSQADVSEFQLAMAAVRAGVKVLLREMELAPSGIQNVLLAGAFGSLMDPSDALAAGLLPEVPVERVHSVGNAAGLGAVLALLSAEARQRGRELARAIRYVELSAEPGFNRLFAQSLTFDRSNFAS
jgi:uncharacterized 2Fe-2S/4Fe-4S cluster protein (DUF4445 family)